MTETTAREVPGDPGGLPLMVKAALPAIPGISLLPGVRKTGSALPQLTLTRHDVPVDRDHVAAYAEVCGFGRKETLPLTYPHVLAFGLHMAVMTDGEFPFPAIGTVHLENSITQHRPVAASETLQVTARPVRLRPHAKGQLFDIVTQVHSVGELVWEETSTFLRRGPAQEGSADPGMQLEQVPSSGIEWRLGADLGRRYASVSGDYNPIHLYTVTAKAFGFPRHIAHGMWSTARCVAMLEPRLPDAVRVDVAFKKPVLLPGTVAFGSRQIAGGWEFSLTSPKSGAPHLLGRTTTV
jgi:acyl dehydratase